MPHSLMSLFKSCWQPTASSTDLDANGARQERLFWYKDAGLHSCGEFSMAVVQANNLLEDQCQLESGPLGSTESDPVGTFVGVYDGHGGPEAARYVNDHLFKNLKRFVSEQHAITPETLSKAFRATEDGFLALVQSHWSSSPQLASVGTCCLCGVISNGTLLVANAGDSRAVLGRGVKGGEVVGVQLSVEHNASFEAVRKELRELHPEDPGIVVLKHNVWRVKGLIQVSRSIGDAYLKRPEFNREPLYSKFRLSRPFTKSIMSAEPAVSAHALQPHDQFLIFASDGLWEHLTNQEAVDLVHRNPRNGAAKRLVKAALQEAAKKREMRYSDLKKIDRGVRRHFHDDITAVVLFLDPARASPVRVSIRGGGTMAGGSYGMQL